MKPNLPLLVFLILPVALLGAGCASTDADGDGVADRECRSTESLGSKIRRSVCMSPEEWAVVDERNAEINAENGRLKDRILKQALEQGTQVQGRGFDTPGP